MQTARKHSLGSRDPKRIGRAQNKKAYRDSAIQANTERTTPPPTPLDPHAHARSVQSSSRLLYSYFEKGLWETTDVHATIPKGNMGYDQYTAPDTVM